MKITKLSLICVAMLLTTPCASLSRPRGEVVQHIVICWLKAPGDEAARQQLIDESRSFKGKIAGLLAVSAGQVLPSQRMAVDSTFDVAIVFTFRDRQSLLDYDHHPVHKEAVERVLKPLAAKVVVYDFVDRR